MLEAASVVKLIISVVVAIKDTVSTVKHNKQDCQAIAMRVGTLDADLSSLDNNTAVTRHPAVSSALDGLHQALQQALQVVMDCKDLSTVSRHAKAKKLSENLRQANQNISDQMARVTFVASLQSNIVLNTTQHSQHRVVQSLPQQEGYLVNSHEQEEAAPISSCKTTSPKRSYGREP